MIAYIRGRLAAKNLPFVVIETGGLGYRIEVSLHTFEPLPDIGSEVTLLTQQVIREDAHLLYGFARDDERSLFSAITKVSGFGPRIAMSMLSSNHPDELIAAITQGNKAMLQKIPGIGAKSAERLLVELRDKLGGTAVAPSNTNVQQRTSMDDAVAALVHLGYRQAETNKVLRTLDANEDTATLVRLALRQLSPRV